MPSPAEKQAQRWLTVPEAARYLGATVGFVRALIWDGAVPFVKAGKRFVIDRTDLDAYMVRSKERNAA
ncbi:MAG: excisionase family DNA-binding protein [Candidatus Acidiferrales bacterium]